MCTSALIWLCKYTRKCRWHYILRFYFSWIIKLSLWWHREKLIELGKRLFTTLLLTPFLFYILYVHHVIASKEIKNCNTTTNPLTYVPTLQQQQQPITPNHYIQYACRYTNQLTSWIQKWRGTAWASGMGSGASCWRCYACCWGPSGDTGAALCAPPACRSGCRWRPAGRGSPSGRGSTGFVASCSRLYLQTWIRGGGYSRVLGLFDLMIYIYTWEEHI